MKTLKSYGLLALVLPSLLFLAGCSNSKTIEKKVENPPEIKKVVVAEVKKQEPIKEVAKPVIKPDEGHDMMKVYSEDGFILSMIPHHQEAIDTANIILQKSQYAKLKILAQAIVNAQTKEVTMMKGWMQSRYPSNTKKADYMKMMDSNLGNLAGNELDRSFISSMIKHHGGAIAMAKQVLEVSQKPEIVKLANDIIKTQTAEIKELKHLLEDVGLGEHAD